MIAVIIAAPAVIMLALAYGAYRVAFWPGREGHRHAPGHITARPGYELSGYENGRRVMTLWPAIMAAEARRQAQASQAPQDDAGPVACHNGYCGAWSDGVS